MRKSQDDGRERRRDPRVNGLYSMDNWLRRRCTQLGASALVIADSWGRVLAEYGATHTSEDLAILPGNDPLFSPGHVQKAIFDTTPYIERLKNSEMLKVWPFRFAQGVGYLICVRPKESEWLPTELEGVCAGFRRIVGEERLLKVA